VNTHPIDRHSFLERLGLASLVLSGFLLCYLPFLGVPDVYQVSEGREGVVVREILQGGDSVLPLRNGHIIPSKPILFHWVSWGLAELRGAYGQFELRLPSLFAGAFAIAFTFLLVAKVEGIPAGLFAGLILATCYGQVRLSTDGRVDMLFSMFVTLAICLWLRGAAIARPLTRVRQSTYASVAIACGLAFLTKGPLGLALPVCVIAGISLVEVERVRDLKYLLSPWWVLALLIPLPWYFAAAEKGSESFVGRQVFFENINRFLGRGNFENSKSPCFYFEHLWSQAAPWSLPFALLLISLIASFLCSPVTKARFQARYSQFLLRAGVVWFVVGFLLFSIAAGKRRAYLLPLLPGLALATSLFLRSWYQRLTEIGPQNFIERNCSWNVIRYAILFAIMLASVVLLLVGILAHASNTEAITNSKVRLVIEGIGYMVAEHGPLFGLYAGAYLVLALVFLFRTWRYAQPEPLVLSVLLIFQFILGSGVMFGQGIKGYTHSYRSFASVVSAEVPDGTTLNFVKTVRDESFDGFFFYFGRHVTMHSPKQSPTSAGWYLARRRWLRKQPDSFMRRVTERLEGGRRTDTDDERLVLFYLEQAPTMDEQQRLPAQLQAV